MQNILDHFKSNDIKIHRILLNGVEKISPKNKSEYYTSLTRSIIYQQLNGKAAQTIYDRFTKLIGTPAYSPEKVLQIEIEEMRKVGLSNSKANYVKNIAKATVDGLVKFDEIDKLSNEEVIDQLTQIKGVGRWTAEMFLMFTLGREDVFSRGDYGLKKGIEKIYEQGYDIEELEKKWSPYKTYAAIALWKNLDNN